MQELVTKAYADLRSMPDYLNGLSAWLSSYTGSGDYRDSDLYRGLWADARKVVDDALHEALGLQEYPDRTKFAQYGSETTPVFQTLADAIEVICDRGELARGAERLFLGVPKSCFRHILWWKR